MKIFRFRTLVLVIIGGACASTIDVLEPEVSKIDFYSSFIIPDEYETDFEIDRSDLPEDSDIPDISGTARLSRKPR